MKVWITLDKNRQFPHDVVFFENEDGSIEYANPFSGIRKHPIQDIKRLLEVSKGYAKVYLICEVNDD